MSARGGPIGATNRSDLFISARSNNNTERSKVEDAKPVQGKEFADLENDEDQNPLQIEHVMGYSGDFRHTVLAAVNDDNVYIKSLGSLVLVENLIDPHNQKLLRGHDMEVSALCMSSSGQLIASGQVGTKSFKGYAAPIFVWQMNHNVYHRCLVLRGLSVRVNLIAISPDEKFVCGCGEDSLLYIWDLSSGEVVFGQRLSGKKSASYDD
jgi:WD40 repeat protein